MELNKVEISKIQWTTIISHHDSNVNSIQFLSDGRLASCSDDKTIKIFNIKNHYHCDITITGHTDWVRCFCQIENGNLISCSRDLMMKIWNITQFSFQCECTITKVHENAICKIIPLPNYRIASCSGDKLIKIWKSIPPYNLIKILKGHFNSVNSILFLKEKDLLISGSCDLTLRFWNISTYQCITIITNVFCLTPKCLIQIDNNKIAVGGQKTLALINLDAFAIEEMFIHEEVIFFLSLLQLRDGNILCGCDNGILYIYDREHHRMLPDKIEDYAEDIAELLRVNDHQFFGCTRTYEIKLWEY